LEIDKYRERSLDENLLKEIPLDNPFGGDYKFNQVNFILPRTDVGIPELSKYKKRTIGQEMTGKEIDYY
jgi:hypothetical protein